MRDKNMANVCAVYGKFLAKNFDNGNFVGNNDFSILYVFCNLYFPCFSIFKV